jgi:tRNA A-37 threonylcarbamoyl transferase component Bud32
MTDKTRLLDLVVRWEELQGAGQDVTPEELCADCPELIEALRERIQALSALKRVLDVGDTQPMSNVPPPLVAPGTSQLTLAGYEILDELGRGGMGVVYKARQVGLDRIVALKTILPRGAKREEQTRRFLQEAKAMALLQHPNVVQIHEIGDCDGRPYLVMEYVGGGNLSEKLAAKPIPPRNAAEMVARLARAVAAAHEQGVIHRDLKPSNILLTADGTPKIADFGLAKWFATPADATETGHPLGTPSYMAPEQFSRQRGPLGPTVDVYALGTILYELLIGHPPFLTDNPLDTLQLVLAQEPVPPRRWQPKTPRDLETICLKCLEKEPRRRYATAQALADDLDRFLAGAPISARAVSGLERIGRWANRHRSVAALMVLAVVATLTVLVVISVFNRRLAGQLDRTAAEHRQVLATRERLDRALTQKEAEQLESDLRELAAVPTTLATLLEKNIDGDEAGLEQMLRELLLKSPRIFGMCVALEPYEWRADRADFALYVYRREGNLAARQLLPPGYEPLYREWEWYRAALSAPEGRWSEPYVGRGAGHVPMVSFSAPIHRHGRFAGVVTADLAMDYFRALRHNIDDLDLGTRGYYFVVSAAGKILAHREDRCEFPGPESDLAKVSMDDSFRKLVTRFTRETSGVGRAIDPATGQPATFQFTCIPSTGWTLVRVAP